MSTAPSEPTPSPIPKVVKDKHEAERVYSKDEDAASDAALPLSPIPSAPSPKLRFQVHDLTHPGTSIFFGTTHPVSILSDAMSTVLRLLYFTSSSKNPQIPPVRSVTLIIRSMGGVAYTTGLDLDDDHKEIHFSLEYIEQIQNSKEHPTRQRDEIRGVIVHEMVHVWQWNALGTCNGGLIEGIADWIRLRAGLAPPHWKRSPGGDWDAGYDRTAYFLDWLESEKGKGTVRRINAELRAKKYEEGKFWQDLFGESIATLWERYGKGLRGEEAKTEAEGVEGQQR